MLQAMWKNSHATIVERLHILREAQKMLEAGSLDEAARKNAESAAHKLAGVLGTFGLPCGTELASRIEEQLASSSPLDASRADELRSWLNELEAVIASKPV